MEKNHQNLLKSEMYWFLKSGTVENGWAIGNDLNIYSVAKDQVVVRGESTYVYYHDFEIGIFNNRITYIQLNLINKFSKYNSPLKKGFDFARVIKNLNELIIDWAFVSKLTFEDQLAIRTEGGVDLLFGINKLKRLTLEKVSIFDWNDNNDRLDSMDK